MNYFIFIIIEILHLSINIYLLFSSSFSFCVILQCYHYTFIFIYYITHMCMFIASYQYMNKHDTYFIEMYVFIYNIIKFHRRMIVFLQT